jgi:imidazolonepropionase
MPEPATRGALVAARVLAPAPSDPGFPAGGPTAVAWSDGEITYVGPADGLPGDAGEPEVFPVSAVVPGFVDCHTHLPFVGWRADEFEARLSGRSYRELHGRGGGIPRSAAMLATASDDEVIGFCLPLLAEMADHGTTTVELKTGYGLSVEAELRQARLARRLADLAAQACVVTLLACHAVPPGMARDAWVGLACEELIPAAAAEGLADAVDVYVEDIAFGLDDLERVAAAAAAAGLPLRCHAEQLGPTGAAVKAARLGARSVDHLNHLDLEGVRALADTDTVAVLLPTSSLSLGLRPAPARALLDAGARVALGTDLNPGTSAVLSVPEAVAFACLLYGLTPEEALSAATSGAASVLGCADRAGTLAPGRPADLVVLEAGVRDVPYRPGHDPVLHTFVGGRRVGGR